MALILACPALGIEPIFRGTDPDPIILTEFDGVIDSPATKASPDTGLAVGPGAGAAGRVIMVTNAGVQIWDKTGAVIAGPTPLEAIFPPQPGELVFHPRLLYDQHYGRFFMVCLEGVTAAASTIHIATSADGVPNNLNSAWTFTSGSGRHDYGSDATWADYPSMGADASALFVTTNQIRVDGNIRGATIHVFDKDLLAGGT